jgi:hypothetical protein
MNDPFPIEGLFGPPLPFHQGTKYDVRSFSKNNEKDRQSTEYKKTRMRVLTALDEIAKRDGWIDKWTHATAPISLDMARLRRAARQTGPVGRRPDEGA